MNGVRINTVAIAAAAESAPAVRRILTDEEMKEMWRRIDEKKLDKSAKP
jgi:hypothetical protein